MGARSVARSRGITVAAVAAVTIASGALAAEPVTLTGRLTPPEGSPGTEHGRGVAVLAVTADGSDLSYEITYDDVALEITRVHLCAASIPWSDTEPMPCTVVLDWPGGPSPIVGTIPLGTQLAAFQESVATGWVRLALDHQPPGDAGRIVLEGFVREGPLPPDTSTAVDPDAGHAPWPGMLSGLAALATGVAMLARLVRPRPTPVRTPDDRRDCNDGEVEGRE